MFDVSTTSRVRFMTLHSLLLLGLGACSSNKANFEPSGGSTSLGGAANAGGATTASSGKSGSSNTGAGGSSGAATANGGTSSGGTSMNGGVANAGSANAGTSAGGANAGARSSGGSMNGGVANAGSANAGTSAGGANAGTGNSAGANAGAGGANSACPGADATEFELVSSWLNNTAAMGALPAYAYNNIRTNFPAGAAFNRLACSIAMSCVEFAPMESNWLRKCEAVLSSAIVAESSYNPSSVVVDTYATRNVGGTAANDPTVGLLQIRFSSTVHDYNYFGPMAKMAAIGCSWPAALTTQADTAAWWATNGGTSYLSFMQDVACNIGLASWYYLYNATGNGGANAVYISNYCSGQGIAGTMVTGLLSHLLGGAYPRPPDANNAYPWGIECCAAGNPSVSNCTGCMGRFAAFMGIGTANARPSPDPFQEQLVPEPTKYCK